MNNDELDDLLDVVSHLSPRLHADRPRAGGDGLAADVAPRIGMQVALALPAPPLVVMDDELAQVADILALRGAAQRKHKQRSWEAAQHARNGRAVKRAKLEAQRARESRDAVVSQLVPLLASFPVLQQVVNLPKSLRGRALDDHIRVDVVVRLGTLPAAVGGRARAGATQVPRCCSALAKALHVVQQEAISALLAPARCAAAADRRILVYSTQWDETMQRMRNPDKSSPWRKGGSTQQVRIQSMVQAAKLDSMVVGASGETMAHEECPYFIRTQFLWRQTANFLLEAIQKVAPFAFHDAARITEVACAFEVVILAFARDGASANSLALEWVWDQVFHSAPANVIPISHLCALHKTAIARSRVQGVLSVAAALQSLTKLIRIGKNLDGVSQSIHHVVSTNFVVVCAPRPEKYDLRAKKLVELLFMGGDEQNRNDYLFKTLRDGRRVPTTMYADLLSYLDVVDVQRHDDEDDRLKGFFVHWCCVREGSMEHLELGLRVGDKCCENEEQSLSKTVGPILQWITGRAWLTMAISRWTHVPVVLRRALVASLGPRNILAEALDHMRNCWEVEFNLERDLARMLSIDKDDFSTMQKLRLLRVCKVLCKDSAALKMAMGMTTTSPADQVMYSVFGFNRKRSNILDLMRPGASPITKAQERAFELLATWLPDDDNMWATLAAVGADFALAATRMQARAQALQMSAGILDAFELQMCRPPYSLVVLCFDLQPEVVEFVLRDWLHTPEECLPLGALRLKRMYGGVPRRPELIAPIMKSWAENSYVSIDLSERNHNRMRNDLSSGGQGRSPTLSSNRVFNREVLASHVARGGTPLHEKARAKDQPQPSPRQGLGGNPKMEFTNKRRKVFKLLSAPDRPLSEVELKRCKCEADSVWAAMDADERQSWSTLHFAASAGRRSAHALVVAAAAHEEPFTGLWGLSQDKHEVVPTEVLVKHSLLARGSRSSDKEVWQDESLNIKVAPDRVGHIRRGWGKGVDGCLNEKKNICRAHSMSADDARNLEHLTKLVSSMVDGLGKESVQAVKHLIRFVGYETDAQDDAGAICYLALLVDARYSPKMQYFARCEAIDDGPCIAATKPLPFHLKISDQAPRLPGNDGKKVALGYLAGGHIIYPLLVPAFRHKRDTQNTCVWGWLGVSCEHVAGVPATSPAPPGREGPLDSRRVVIVLPISTPPSERAWPNDIASSQV